MAYLQFVPDLFLEVAELERFRQSLDDNGFRKNLLENSISFGFIKTDVDAGFLNGKVERDVDSSLGQKTLKVGAIKAIDNQGRFIVNNAVNNIPVPADNSWYWLRAKHVYTSQEKGKVSIDSAGNLVGVGTEFTKILRGQPNFPSTIKFINSADNTLEYEVLEVTDDTHAVLVYPGINVDTAEFISESNLFYQIVGTFTEGVAIDEDDKFPFKYDSCTLELVAETVANTRPTYVVGQEFYLARVSVQVGNLIIQDKRLDYWETKGSNAAISIDRNANALIGVEAVKWENAFNSGDKNIVQLAWGMRSSNWAVDSSQNLVTFYGSSLGGSFKTTADFTNGDFNGWRLYSPNGRFRKVVNSIKQGGAINLFLDVLDIDDYSTDGGTTFTEKELLVAPNCEEVQIRITANPTDSIFNTNELYTFPVNTPIAECLATVYKDATCLVSVEYRYKSFKEFAQWRPIKSGSYFTEVSFKSDGSLVAPDDRVTYSYVTDSQALIQLTLSPESLYKFKSKVYKGDVIGVNTITGFTAGQVLEMKVGVSDRYQHIVGNINLTDDVYISLENLNAVEGNEFTFHLECDSLNLGSNKIFIVDNYSSGITTVVKEISKKDVYAMLNQDGGIVIKCVFNDLGNWIASQNYDLGRPYEIIDIDGVITDLFDSTTGLGKVRGLFGYVVCDDVRTVDGVLVPDLSDKFLVGVGNLYNVGDTGGENQSVLLKENLPSTKVQIKFTSWTGQRGTSSSGTGHVQGINPWPYGKAGDDRTAESEPLGDDQPIDNRPPYYAIIKAKKVF